MLFEDREAVLGEITSRFMVIGMKQVYLLYKRRIEP